MPSFDSTFWIVHRDPGPRAALGRLSTAVAGRHEIVLGRPGDAVFDAASPADVIVLDLTASGPDPEPELEFARRMHRRLPHCAWVLVAEPDAVPRMRRLFDALEARVIPGPADLRSLRAALAGALQRRQSRPLSRRIGRDNVSARFARWFSSSQGLGEPPELALALDPRLALEPVLARGEPGTGRGLLLRYVHTLSTRGAGPFVRVACTRHTRPEELVSQIEEGAREAGSHDPGLPAEGRFGIWLAEVDRLPETAQARVLDWMEFGLPLVLPSSVRGGARWFASAGPDSTRLDPQLALAFAELTIRTVPLRRRPGSIEAFVLDTARAWSSARGEAAKSFDAPAIDLLRAEPWPGNLAELEAVVIRSLAHAPADTRVLRIGDLRFDPELPANGTSGNLPAERPTVETSPASTSVAPPSPAEAPPAPAAPRPGAGARPIARAITDAEAGSEPLAETILESEGERPPAPEPQPPPEHAARDDRVARLATAVAHEVRNPLVSIRTFSELLDEHYADEEFRTRFGRLVADDVRRIEDVVERLEQMGEAGPSEGTRTRFDMTALLESLLDGQRAHLQSKRLLVLKELDRARPFAFGDEGALRRALGGLLDHAIDEVPERGDLYLASRHQPGTPERATMRIVLRYRVQPSRAPGAAAGLPTLRDTVLDRSLAESVVTRQGGSLRVDTTDRAETQIEIDLPAPGPDWRDGHP